MKLGPFLGSRTLLGNLNDVLRAYGDGTLWGTPYGNGAPQVLWLHGWARTSHDFDVAAVQLASEGVSSLALDLPGFGESPPPSHAGGARYYAELLSHHFDEWSTEPLVVVGHSFGGRVAAVLAATYPDRVRSLVLVGAPLLRRAAPKAPPRRYRSIRWLHAHHLVSEQRMEAARQKYGSRDYRNASGIIRDVLVASVAESLEEELIAIRVPVVLLWGSNDTEVPLDVATAAQAFVSTSELRVLEGVGHLVPTEQPDALAAIVRGLVS